MKKNRLAVGVFFGGKSTEHEVSVITGLQVLNNINKRRYEIVPVYVSKEDNWYTGNSLFFAETFKNLSELPTYTQEIKLDRLGEPIFKVVSKGILKRDFPVRIDVAMPCFHGGTGENGSFQGLFEVLGIPYVGSGVLGSALGMDKILTKMVLSSKGIKAAPFYWFFRSRWQKEQSGILKELESRFSYPMFVKPANSGSSIGVSKAKNREELKNNIEVACSFDRKVLVEQGIEGAREINISVLGNSGGSLRTSVCEEVFSSGEFLSYDDKYRAQGGKSRGMASAKREIPAKIKRETQKEIENLARGVFCALDCSGLARVDFLVKEKEKEFYVIEVNTIPGSLSFYLWEKSGMAFSDLIDELINLALERFKDRKKTTRVFASNILENFESSIKSPKLG